MTSARPPSRPPGEAAPKPLISEREAKLAQALRANLRRRKLATPPASDADE